jgi:hypothetical protein
MRDTRTLGTECHDLIETLYGQALAAGDELLSERCSAAMEALRDIGRVGEPLRLEAGGVYVTRDFRRVRIVDTEYRYGSDDSFLCLGLISLPSGGELIELYTFEGRRFLGRSADPSDIVGLWHDGLAAPAPALPEPYPQAAE